MEIFPLLWTAVPSALHVISDVFTIIGVLSFVSWATPTFWTLLKRRWHWRVIAESPTKLRIRYESLSDDAHEREKLKRRYVCRRVRMTMTVDQVRDVTINVGKRIWIHGDEVPRDVSSAGIIAEGPKWACDRGITVGDTVTVNGWIVAFGASVRLDACRIKRSSPNARILPT